MKSFIETSKSIIMIYFNDNPLLKKYIFPNAVKRIALAVSFVNMIMTKF